MVDRDGHLKVVGIGAALGRALAAEDAGGKTVDNYGRRLDKLGRPVVDLAEKIGADERVGAAV